MSESSLSKIYEPRESEAKWYQYWLDHGFFRAEDTSSKTPFSIVIPPPNVTGMLHMGHALNNTLQDIIIRYKRMQGFNALWMPGTDHAGIATQNVVEQELAKEGITRHDLGREKFIERVWEWKKKYGGVIINQLKRLGCSCDWTRECFTMDENLSKAVREVFVRLYKRGLIYQGDYIVNWCPRCHTAISDLEVEYKEAQGFLWHIRYPYAEGTGEIVVVTTRPETMLGDTAVAVNPDDVRYKDRIGSSVILPLMNRKIPIIADHYVSMEFGSGAVKITPAHDPNDFAIAERHSLEVVKIMDGSAIINENGGVYQGLDRYEGRENVVRDLESKGYLVGTEPYVHNVGQCYRCKTHIEPMVSRQWFLKIKPLAKVASAAVVKGKTRMLPSMWEATYFEWMNNIRDWCISRQIWWGHRIPVWYCDSCGKMIVSTKDPASCPDCGNTLLRQEEDVLDTWFSSALWPFSTLGWPEQTKALKTFYPTSLLVTGFDILFFWVARMMMMGLFAMKDVPFRDVYLHALVRDEKGEKMSKSLGNIIDPIEMVEKYGTDAFRFTLAAFTAQGRDVKMSEERIEGYKYFVNKIWNAARFSLMNLEDYSAEEIAVDRKDASLPDRWINHQLNKTITEVTKYLDEYRFNEAAAVIYQFIWHEFCDWYLELIKPILYGKISLAQRHATQQTLFNVLKMSLKLLHPFMPFVTEEIWQTLINDGSSIMVSDFPIADDSFQDIQVEKQMRIIMDVVTRVRNIRGEMNITPSKKLRVVISAPEKESNTIITAGRDHIVNLANLDTLAVGGNMEEPKDAATGVVGSIRVFVLLEGMMDVAGELARLEKEMARSTKDLTFISKKLANRDFMAKASKSVIEKEEEKFRVVKEKHVVLEAALKKIRNMNL
jgi:valyl-tRNA synthetase